MDGGSVTTGASYYMCLFVDNDSANTFSVDKSSTNTTVHVRTSSGMYDNMDSTLYNPAAGWNNWLLPQRSVYVTITP